ncbi:MAG: WG repeat-containing protein [Gemmiger sp.]|nr:WG repeat-containing protein [Gemmiger sp.]
MKKRFYLPLFLSAALLLSGCGPASSATVAAGTATPAPAQTATPAPAATATPAPAAAPLYRWVVEPTLEAESLTPALQMRGGTDREDFNAIGYPTNDGCMVVVQGGKYGLIDSTGSFAAPCQYDGLVVGYDARYLLWQGSESDPDTVYFTIDEAGQIQPADERMEYDIRGTAPNVALVWVPELEGIYKNSGADSYLNGQYTGGVPVVASYVTELVTEAGGSAYYTATDGWVLTDGVKPVNDTRYEDAGNYSCGVVPVKQDGQWGYLDAAGNTVIPFGCEPCIATGIEGAKNRPFDATYGSVVVCQNGQYALYDTTGAVVIPFGDLEALLPAYQDTLWAKKDGKWGVIQLATPLGDTQAGR